MTKTIVNLALSTVVAEVETILDSYPSHPYQQAFSIPDMRQKLISYVLSRIPGIYTVVDDMESIEIDPASLHLPEYDLKIRPLIHQGIQQILADDADWIDRHIPQDANPSFAPSTWFG